MPIKGIEQPDSIQIENTISLRKDEGDIECALTWLQAEDNDWKIDGDREIDP